MHAHMSVQSSQAVVAKATVLLMHNSFYRHTQLRAAATNSRGVNTDRWTNSSGPPTWLQRRLDCMYTSTTAKCYSIIAVVADASRRDRKRRRLGPTRLRAGDGSLTDT